MLEIKTKAHLDGLLAQDIQESQTLEYKDAAALGRDAKQRDELFKDVSAMANAAGGQIVYGMQEKDQHPIRVQDADGVEIAKFSREWLEQVIDSNIQPRIVGLHIQPIDVAAGRAAYVITVPRALTAHQAPNHKYYVRQNFQAVSMPDYQVRDVMRRATAPELFVELSFPGGAKTAEIGFVPGADVSRKLELDVVLHNRTNQPAFHSVVMLGIDSNLAVVHRSVFEAQGQMAHEETPQNRYVKFMSERDFPVFKEMALCITPDSNRLGFTVSAALLGDLVFWLTTTTATPGFTKTETWAMVSRAGTLTLHAPGQFTVQPISGVIPL